MPLEVLTQAEATVNIRVDQLVLSPQLTAKALELDMTLKDGQLTVQPLRARIGGGTLDAQIDVHAKDKDAVLASKFTLQRVDLSRVPPPPQGAKPMQGQVNVTLALQGSGPSPNTYTVSELDVQPRGQAAVLETDVHVADFDSPLALVASSLKRDTKARQNPCLAAIQAVKEQQQKKGRKQ